MSPFMSRELAREKKLDENPALDFSFVLASSVHDMKNSLGMLLNTLSDVMEKYPPQDDAHAQSYAVLEYEAARINSELIQLLSLYRLDNDKIRVHIDQCFVMDVLTDQVARNHDLLQSRKITLELDCDESLQGYFDVDLVGGVINNLLVNCSRYCKERLRLSARDTADGICFAIEDDGPGYPPDMLNSSSEDETRAGFAQGRPHLGLLFASKIARMHRNKSQQGFIALSNDSNLGGGCFKIYLP